MVAPLLALLFAAGSPKLAKPVSLQVWATSVALDFELADPATPTVRLGAPGTEPRIVTASEPATRFRVAVDGLQPATSYAWSVELQGKSIAGTVLTAPKAGARVPFTFAVVGDARDHAKWAEVAHAVAAMKPAFVLTTGDNVEDPKSEADWRDYYLAGQELFANVPVFSAMGNHDVGPLYERFNPAPRSSSGSQSSYAFVYGNAAFVALDTNHLDDAQRAWLARTLPGLSGGPLFVFQHHPLYSCGGHGSDPKLQQALQPLFEQARVTMDFAGHDHDLIAWKPRNGVRYYVSGGGGTVTYGLGNCTDTEFARKGYGFMLVRVEGASVSATFFDERGVDL